MPISSFLGLQTSLRGLLAPQQALDVSTHNVANANTVGYTRQEATLGAANALHIAAGVTQDGTGAFIGQGVDVTAYRRIRDSFLDLQVRAQTMALGDGSTSAEALDRVQSAVNEPSTTGINSKLSDFYKAWNTLANNPSDAKQAGRGQEFRELIAGVKSIRFTARGRTLTVEKAEELSALMSSLTPQEGPTAGGEVERRKPLAELTTADGKKVELSLVEAGSALDSGPALASLIEATDSVREPGDPGIAEPRRLGGPADPVTALEDERPSAGPGQIGGGDQRVVAAADDDGVPGIAGAVRSAAGLRSAHQAALRRRDRRTSIAAIRPFAPMIPPPGWVAEPHSHRSRIGVRKRA